MKHFRRYLILCHRYLGIALSLLFVLWFTSGITIMYTGGMPQLSPAERLQSQPALEFSDLLLTPAQAQAIAGFRSTPTLLTIMGRPAYRFSRRGDVTVFADDGELLADHISSQQIARDFTGAPEQLITRIGRVDEVDQWTLTIQEELPLEKYRIDDGQGTEVYVSPEKGQVVLATTSRDRLLAWVGAIPHWFYFTGLRKNAALWTDTVVWLASLATLLAIIGMVLLFTQLKRTRPFSLSRAIPYRGLVRWHYILGIVFGLVTMTWVFSGLLSIEPYRWTAASGLDVPRGLFQDGPVQLDKFSSLTDSTTQQSLQRQLKGAEIKEIGFARVGDKEFYILTHSSDTSSWGYTETLINASTRKVPPLFDSETILTRLSEAITDHSVVANDVLKNYDNYYYSRSSSDTPAAPLPVLRVKFDDPAQSWFYLDLKTSRFVYQSHRLGRLKRWLYNGLHSLDFRFWYGSRPLWDIGVIFLLLGGLALCGVGCYLGFKRLYRDSRRMLR